MYFWVFSNCYGKIHNCLDKLISTCFTWASWNCDRNVTFGFVQTFLKLSNGSWTRPMHFSGALYSHCTSASLHFCSSAGENVFKKRFKITDTMSVWSWVILGAVGHRAENHNSFLIWATFSSSQLRNKWIKVQLCHLSYTVIFSSLKVQLEFWK